MSTVSPNDVIQGRNLNPVLNESVYIMIMQRLISSIINMICFVSEISALQTAVSDLTSNLKGENALFREYDVYASKTLFSSQKSDILMNQQSVCVSFQILQEIFFSSLFWRQDRVL
jgi:hypothetical protein